MVEVSMKQRQSEEAIKVLKRWEDGTMTDEEFTGLMRKQLERRLQWGYKPTYQEQLAHNLNLLHSLKQSSIATETDTLDSKIYEIPMSFLKLLHGKFLKQSCCYFKDESTTLDEAEIAMLDLYCERARIEDGQSVLDLGCGQGSLTLYIAEKYKNCKITAVTNSVAQKNYIEEQCKLLQLSNVKVVLEDLTELEMEDTFDKIMVVGLFEHMRNYGLLLKRISKWMADDGLLFVEHVCHKVFAYEYEPIDEDDWYTNFAFPAGTFIMLSSTSLLYFQDDVSVVDQWIISGKHFARTKEEWLKNLDKNKDAAMEIFETVAGSKEGAAKLLNLWRALCFLSRELCAYNNGEEWMFTQLVFKKK